MKDLAEASEIKRMLHPLRNKGNKASEPEVALPRHGVRNQVKEIARLMA